MMRKRTFRPRPDFSWSEPELSATRERGFRRKERLPQKPKPLVAQPRPAVLARPLTQPPITARASLRSFAKTRGIQVDVKLRGKWIERDLGSVVDNLRALGVSEQELARRFGLEPAPYEFLKKRILEKIREER